MPQPNRRGAGLTRARAYLRDLDDREISTRYEQAVIGMASVPFLADVFEEAADVAINISENAKSPKPRKFYPERTLDRKAWNLVNAAAGDLKDALAALDGAAVIRLQYASRSANMRLSRSQLAIFPKMLGILSQQQAKEYGRANCVVRPIMVAKADRKRLSVANAVTIGLAHVFGQLKRGVLVMRTGVVIDNAAAWDVAADFSQAATGKGIGDASSAKKLLSDHRGDLVYIG